MLCQSFSYFCFALFMYLLQDDKNLHTRNIRVILVDFVNSLPIVLDSLSLLLLDTSVIILVQYVDQWIELFCCCLCSLYMFSSLFL